MDKSFFEVFPALECGQNLKELLSLVTVQKLRYSKDRKFLLVYLTVPKLIDKKMIHEIEKRIDSLIDSEALCSRIIETYDLPDNYTLDFIVEEYRESLISEIESLSKLDFSLLKNAVFSVGSDSELIVRTEENTIGSLRENTLKDWLHALFLERFLMNVSIRFENVRSGKTHRLSHQDTDTVILDRPVEDPADTASDAAKKSARSGGARKAASGSGKQSFGETGAAADASQDPASSKARPASLPANPGREGEVKSFKKTYVSDDPNLLFGRPFDDPVMPISSYSPTKEGLMVIRGVIMDTEVRELRNGERSIFSFSLTDYTDSITVKLFLGNDEAAAIKSKITVGTTIRLRGIAQFDKFDNELSIRSCHGIVKIDETLKTRREDHAEVKRVELHCHTKASENDGVAEVKDLLSLTQSWGHRALAITDHGCVYAFPEALKNNKKDDFKVIYGMEGYLVDDTKEIVVNPENHSLDDETVVFDIETTGFSPVHNRIIEIGAVKVKSGKVIERFSTFVDPKTPIPYRIEELTGISDADVSGAPDIETALADFLEFSKDCILVAHNAEFDVSFIREKAVETGLSEHPLFSYIDTVGVARMLLPQLSNYRLEHLAKELSVPLGNHHRAVDDAECTAFIYLKLMDRLKARDLYSLSDVQNAMRPDANAIKKMPAHHVILLAANDTGRVNLYTLVTESSLTYFGVGRSPRPKIPKSLLSKLREGLIIGSACEAGEVFEAVKEGESEDEIARLVNFYDYLEIQPIGNNEFLLKDRNCEAETIEDLQNYNRTIVALGQKYHKPVCATCDVHFVNPEDSIYREILQYSTMNGKKDGDGEAPAPLYLRTTDEMLDEFAYLGAEKAYEVVVTNTNMIADRIEKISPVRPDTCPPKIENSDEDLRNSCLHKAKAMYGDPLPKIVEERLEKELNAIISHGYAVMYIIAQKLVKKSNSDGYLVGSRGSVGSSLVATMADITEVNPLPPHYRCGKCLYSDFDSEEIKEYGSGVDMPDKICPVCGEKLIKDGFRIPFETFLGFKGDKEPDIDLNFSGEYQAKAHAYTEVIFGKGQTFKAGTIGTVAEKTAIGYVIHYMEENNIEKRHAEIRRIAKGIEGVRRTSGQHPGGIIVLPIGENINTFTPVQHPANDQTTNIITTHFDYHSIQHNLLKLDILGHDDPTMLRMLQDLTKKDPTKFPLDSPEVMSLFQNTEALGVTPEDLRGCPLGALGIPEFGTDNAINMLLTTKPQHFSDLVRISGLAHGTDVWAGNAEKLIQEGTATIQTAICCRDDIMEYLISKNMEPSLSFTIMESVRKGKGLKPDWEEEMRAHDVPEWYIWSCKKIQYMFPKAHAAAYVMMAWRIAYCKVFYPLAYYAAFFSIRAKSFSYEIMCLGKDRLEHFMDNYEARWDTLSDKEQNQYKDMKIVQEMYARGFSFVPIDVYRSKASRFEIVDDKHLLPCFNAIDGLGETAAAGIEAASKGGPYLSLMDFRNRTKVNQTTIDKMVELNILSSLPKDNQFSLFD